MQYRLQDRLKAIAGFAVAIAIIGLFTWKVGWDQILANIAQAELEYVALACVIAFGGLTLVGATWWIAVRDVAALNVVDGLRVFFITYFANSITPLGQFGGEPFIAYILSRDADIPMEESLGAVIVADAINAIPFFTMSLLGIFAFLLFFPLNDLVSLILKLVVGLLMTLVVTIMVIATNRPRALHLLHRIGDTAVSLRERLDVVDWTVFSGLTGERLVERGEAFFDIIDDMLQQKQMLWKALVLSHISSLAGPVAFYFFFLAMGIENPVFSALLFIVPASMLAGFLPLPGGLGGIEFAMTALLVAITGIPATIASASVLLFRAATYWLGLLIGGYFASQFSVEVLASQYDL